MDVALEPSDGSNESSTLQEAASPSTLAAEVEAPSATTLKVVFGDTLALPSEADLTDPSDVSKADAEAAQLENSISTAPGTDSNIALSPVPSTQPTAVFDASIPLSGIASELVETLRAANGPPTVESSSATPVVVPNNSFPSTEPVSSGLVDSNARPSSLDLVPISIFSTSQNGLSGQAQPVLTAVSLSGYSALMQSQSTSAAQVIIVDGAVPEYASLINSLIASSQMNSGLTHATVLPQLAESQLGISNQASAGNEPNLLTAKIGQFQVVVLDTRFDGAAQITEILQSHQDLDAVQILSHGGPGKLRLGSSQLDPGTLAQKQSQISTWGNALSPEGDMLLFGCDVAQGTVGVQFIQNLARITGADVAASTNSTGGSALGGDWVLEYATGVIEERPLSATAALSNYGSLLNTLTDLDTYIGDLLASEGASFTSTEQLGSALLGGFLQLDGLTLTVNATLSAGGAWSGTVSLSATSATFFNGKSFSAVITPDVAGQAALTGIYTIGAGYELSIPTTAGLVMHVGEALTIVASNISFTYNPNGPETQTLATLQTAGVSTQFTGMPAATLSNFALRADGFSFDAFTLSSDPLARPGIGDYIKTTGVALTVSAFNVSFGTTTNPTPSLVGTVALTVTGLQLYPSANFITYEDNGVTAAYSFASFDGTSLTGQLTLTVSGFQLQLGEAVLLTTGGTDVVLSPGQQVLVKIGAATLSSPQFGGLGTLAVNNLEIRQDGFSLGSLGWNSNGKVTIGGDILSIDSMSITLSSLALQYGATPVVGGSISFAASGVVLFPNIALLNLNLGTLSGVFDFGNVALPGAMTLTIPNLNIPLGDALMIHLGDVDLHPGQLTMLNIPNVQLSAGLFTGLPDITLPNFVLTQSGFSLGTLSFPLTAHVTIGDFLGIDNVTLAINGFAVNKLSTPVISGSISLTLGTMSLFPGITDLTSSFTNLRGSFNFADLLHPGRLSLAADTFSLSLFNQLNLSTGNITFTPGLSTLGTIGTSTLTFPSLSSLALDVKDLAVMRTGFTISAAAVTLPDLNLGGLLTLQAPKVNLTNISYTLGGTLGGNVGFDAAGAALHLGVALDASVGQSIGSYNLASGELSLTLTDFSLSLPNFAEISATSAVLSYFPAVSGKLELQVGASGVTGFVGLSGTTSIGVQVTGGKLGVALYKSSTGTITYALQVSGGVSFVGMLPDSVSFTAGNIAFRQNTAGSVNEVIRVDGDPTHDLSLVFAANETSIAGSGLSLSVGTFVSLSGDFGFQKYTDGSGTHLVIGAANVNATLAIEGVSLMVQGATLGLLLNPGATSALTTYALLTTGGTSTLSGVPGLTLSASGLQVRVRRGLDAKNAAGLPVSVMTPGGSVMLDFEPMGNGTSDVTDIQGTVTLNVENFVSLTGSFGFQKYIDASDSSTRLAVGAKNLSIVLGDSTTNLTLANASLGLIIKPGTGGAATTYALQATGSSVAADTSLNGVTGLTLNATDLLVRVRKGLDLHAATGLPTVYTSGGSVALDFAGLGAGTSDVTDIEGHLTLTVVDFASLEGDFGFQSYKDSTTGAQQILMGARNVNVVVGTSTTNLTLNNASLGVVIKPGTGAVATTYALQATGSSVAADTSLNGVTGLTLNATNLLVRVRKGLDLSAVAGFPTSVSTSGGSVPLDFSGLGSGTSDVVDVQGIVTLQVASFVSMTGAFGFQTYKPAGGTERYFAMGMNGSIGLAADGVNLGIANASVGVLAKQSGTTTTYALQARGSSDAADTTFTGVNGLDLSATNLLVRVIRGLDLSTYPVGVPTSIFVPAITQSTTESATHDWSLVSKVTLARIPSVLTSVVVTSVPAGGGGATTLVRDTDYTLVTGSDAKVSVEFITGHRPAAGATVGLAYDYVQSSGSITLDFSSLGGTTDVTDIQGHLRLGIANFASIEGDFGIQKYAVTGGGSALAIGGKNIQAVLGTADTNVTMTGGTLGLLVHAGDYALMATSGTITLNGVSDLSIGANSLKLRIKHGLDPPSVPGAPTSVQTSAGAVTLDFTGLGAADVTEIQGTATINVLNYASLTGTFSFSKQTAGTVTKILVGGSGVNAYLGTADGLLGVQITNASLGLVIYRDSTATGSRYALQATATITPIGLPSGVTLSGTGSVAINTTGAAVNEAIPGTGVTVLFATGANVKSFGGTLTLTVGTSFSLTGDFSVTKTVNGSVTKVLLGAANIHTATGTAVKADGGTDTFNLSDGTLGMVFYKDGTTSQGYTLSASATATVAVGTALSGKATISLRRNTTTSVQNDTVNVGATVVPLIFVAGEVQVAAMAFQSISLSSASLSIDDSLIITAAAAASTTPTSGASRTALTGITLTLQDPGNLTNGQPTVLFTISAGSAVYVTYSGTVSAATATSSGLNVRRDGAGWQSGDKELVLTNVSFTLGSYVSFNAETVALQHYLDGTKVVNAFTFTNATVAFLDNGTPMASLTGTAVFHYTTGSAIAAENGFILDSFSNPGVGFLGQTAELPTSVTPAPVTAANPSGTVSTFATPRKLGPLTLVSPSISFKDFSFDLSGQVSAKVTIGAVSATITTGPIKATFTGISATFEVGLKFNLGNLTALPTNPSVKFLNVHADSLSIDLGTYVRLSATNVTITPAATANEELVSFASITATLNTGAVSLSGTARNFAITGDGSFLAKTGFSITIELGQNGNADASSVKWPAWLPLKTATVTLYWYKDFNVNPNAFLIQLSATVETTIGTSISLSGSVTNAVIDPQLLFDGAFPIISVDSIAVGASGNLFAGTISGTLIAGIVRFDSTGRTVDGLGNLTGTSTKATGVITNVFYAGIQAGFSFGGMSGFNIRIGLSDFGPLQIYIEAGIPIALGPTGLFLSNFRGGVSFGKSFPTITISTPNPQPSDALQLRQDIFSTSASLTAAQWETQLRVQVQTLFKAGAASGNFANLSNAPILIEAGATLYAANQNAFRVDADMLFDTTGKFLIVGTATIGSTLSIGVKMFADLSQPSASVKLIFLMEVPSQNVPNPVTPPVYSLYGVATFSYINSVFKISIAGAADYNLLNVAKAHVEATLTLTFAQDSFTITLADGAFSLPDIQTAPLGKAAGQVTIQRGNDGSVNLWGGFILIPDVQFLETWGITVGGQVFIKLNTTNLLKQITLSVSGGPVVLDLTPQSFSLFIIGHADFSILGVKIFRVQGTLAIDITSNHLAIFVNADLFLGTDSANPIFAFRASGLIYVQLRTTTLVNAGFAAKITLSQGTRAIPGVVMGAKWLLVMNSTGSEISYEIPTPVATTPPSPQVTTVVGPDFGSADPLAVTSYETIVGGKRTLVIPAGAPNNGLSDYRTWIPAQVGAYFVIVGRGSITVANVFTLTGNFNLVATVFGSSVNFTLETKATLDVKLNGNTVFSFLAQGGIQISNSGVAAALTLTRSAGFTLPASLGFTLDATFQLQLNTTNAPVNLAGVTIPAGPGNLFARIRATGHLKFLGNVVDMHGTFYITVTGASLTVAISADLSFFNATFHAEGFAGIYYDSSPGLALRIQLSLPGGADGIAPVTALGNSFVIMGTFTLELNTSAVARLDSNNVSIAPGFKVAVTNLGVYLFGFNLTGSLSFGITSAGFNIDVQRLNLDLFGFAQVTLSGYYHSADGSFRFTGTASFQYGDHAFGIGGSITVTISNSGFSASISGWVAAFGVEIKGGGSIAITGGSVDVSVYISVTVVPAINIDTPAVKAWGVTIWPAIHIHTPAVVVSGTATFHLGSTSPPPRIAQVTAPPTPPALAGVNSSGQLVLYLGADVGNRVNTGTPPVLTPALSEENYVLSRVAGDPGSTAGKETIRVSALGFEQDYANVTGILVSNTEIGNDTIAIDNAVQVAVSMTLGTGNNTVSTGSGPASITVTGSGTNRITSGNNTVLVISAGANGGNQVTVGAGSTVTLSGNGNNSINLINGGSAASSVTINGTGGNSINITGGAPTITVASTASGSNRIVVNSGSASVFTVNGGGSNSVTATGAGTASITVNGNGANQVAIGGGSATITVAGNGANTVTTGGGATTVYLRGSGSNQVTGAAGYATIYDQGIGGNTIRGGAGGGIYYGGLNSSGVAYTTKGDSSLTTTFGNFAADIRGYSTYTLNDNFLAYGSLPYSLGLNGVRNVTLTADVAPPANVFTLVGWSWSATLKGAGSDNTLLVVPGSGVGGVNYVLGNSSLQVSGGINQTITFSGIQTARLTGASSGVNTFNITAWTGTGSLTGPQYTTNTLVARNDVANFTLSDTLLTRTGYGDMALTGIQFATLDGGASANTFTVNNWSGSGTLDGKDAGDTYNFTLSGSGTGTLNVADSGLSGNDRMNVTSSRTTLVTSSAVRVGTQRVNYSGIEVLNVTGGTGGLVYNTQGTHVIATTTIQTSGNANVINIGSTAGVLPVSSGIVHDIKGALIVVGGGQDTLNLDDAGDSTGHTDGQLTSSTITGLGMGVSGINYSGIQTLSLSFGSGGDTFTILSTHAGTTAVNANGGADIVNVRTIAGVTTINAGAGIDTVNVGSTAGLPGNPLGTILGIAASLTINGDADADTTNVDDRANTTNSTGYLTATLLTGLRLAVGITYDTLESLNIDTGSGNDVFNVRGTSAVTTISLHDGNEQIYVSSLANVAVGAVRPDFLSGNLDSIRGTLNLNGGAGRHLLLVSDESATIGDSAVLITKGLISGLAPANITYTADNSTGNFADGITIWTGRGNDTLNVTSSHKTSGVNEITTLNTGAGGDAVTVGLNALTDGSFVVNTQDGTDTVNAVASTLGLVIFGGDGIDNITTGSGGDVVFGDRGRVEYFDALGQVVTLLGNGGPGDKTDGVLRPVSKVYTVDTSVGGGDTITAATGAIVLGGAGSDIINLGSGTSIVLGDHGLATFSSAGLLATITTTNPTAGAADTITSTGGSNVIFGGYGADIITGGSGDDVVIGDNGNATFTTGILTAITTDDASVAVLAPGDYNDIIKVGDGSNTVLGGSGSDTITGGRDRDVVLGDNGRASFTSTGILSAITTTDPTYGASDSIDVAGGNNVVIGGLGTDYINVDKTTLLRTANADGDDVIVGDNGKATFATGTGASVLTFITTATAAPSVDADLGTPDLGAKDYMDAGDGSNTVLGGAGGDVITGGTGGDVIVGDDGNATFTSTGILTQIITTDPAIGGDDIIKVGDGSNTVLGGSGSDTITGGKDRDVVLGDNGRASFTSTGILSAITTTDPTYGDSDSIDVAGGNNVVIGGLGTDYINVDKTTLLRTANADGDDVIVGDNGRADFNTSSGVSVLTYITTGFALPAIDADLGAPDLGATDYMDAGDGSNTVLGGAGGDVITGGTGGDVVVGDDGNATFTSTGILTQIITTDPAIGGDDIIQVGDGSNTVLGGSGSDTITGGKDRDVVLGDNGRASFTSTGILSAITTIDPTYGDGDSIDVAGGNNVVIGGLGTDYINVDKTTLLRTANADGDDVIVGDNGRADFNTSSGVSVLTYITTGFALPAIDADLGAPDLGATDYMDAGDGSNTVLGGAGGDVITGGTGGDVIVGDDGNATFTVAGVLTFITISDPSIGGGDTIYVGDGLNVILGGIGADTITGGRGRDIVVGDNGDATFDSTGVLTLMQTSFAILAGSYDDIINLGSGNNVVLGGNGGDTITTTTGDDQILGDNGKATFDSTAGNSIIRELISTDDGIGGDDIINAGSGNNLILGGFGKDRITSLGGDDIAAGDNAHAVFGSGGILTFFTSISPDIGDDDTIDVGDGFNIVLGGFGKDTLTGGAGVDLFIGDNGNAAFTTAGILTDLTTSDHTIGDDDIIYGNGGDDMIFGGRGADFINGGSGDDTIVGDHGSYSLAIFLLGTNPRGITLLEEIVGWNDTIYGGDGNDLIYSEGGDDYVDAQAGDDVVFAGYGNDIVYGGADGDTLLGGPGYDFLDGMTGSDSLYVDPFDTWAGGMPEDTIIGGPFFSTNSQLAFGLPILGSSPDVPLILVILPLQASFAIIATVNSFAGGFDDNLSILSLDLAMSFFAHEFEFLRWSGSARSFALFVTQIMGQTFLIGIGDFLEVLWADLIALLD